LFFQTGIYETSNANSSDHILLDYGDEEDYQYEEEDEDQDKDDYGDFYDYDYGSSDGEDEEEEEDPGEEYDQDYEEEEEDYEEEEEGEEKGDVDEEELLYRSYEILSDFYKKHFVDLRVLDTSCEPEEVPPPEVDHGYVKEYK